MLAMTFIEFVASKGAFQNDHKGKRDLLSTVTRTDKGVYCQLDCLNRSRHSLSIPLTYQVLARHEASNIWVLANIRSLTTYLEDIKKHGLHTSISILLLSWKVKNIAVTHLCSLSQALEEVVQCVLALATKAQIYVPSKF